MPHLHRLIRAALLVFALTLAAHAPAAQAAEKKSFKVAWSIYVGWMPWDYAAESGILKKWADKYGIKIQLTQINDYVESINQYTAGGFDGCVMTNMDMLTIPSAGGVDSTALIVGDFSNGNDGVVLKGKGKTLADIKGLPVNLVELSVSHYLLARGLETVGPARARHQGRQHLGRGHRRCLRRGGHQGHGHLEAAAQRNPGRAGCAAGVRLQQDSRRDHRPDGREHRDAEGQSRSSAKALVGAWYETLKLMSDAKDPKALAHMAKASGTDLAGFNSQLATTQDVLDAGRGARVRHQPDLVEDHGPGAQVLLRSWPARRRREDASTRSASNFPAARRSAMRRT